MLLEWECVEVLLPNPAPEDEIARVPVDLVSVLDLVVPPLCPEPDVSVPQLAAIEIGVARSAGIPVVAVTVKVKSGILGYICMLVGLEDG